MRSCHCQCSIARHAQTPQHELELGLQLWWQSRVVGVWVWWAAFVAGRSQHDKARVHALLPDTIATLQCLATPGWRERMTHEVLEAARLSRQHASP